MAAKIYKFRVWCVTELAWRYVWTDGTIPTDCPADPGHSIDATKTSIVKVAMTAEEIGGLVVLPLSTPVAPAIEVKGAPGSTVWGYKVTAKNSNGETLASSEAQVSNGSATLNSTNFNRLTWEEVENATSYVVYRSTAGGTPSSLGKLAETINNQLDDAGLAASVAEPGEDLSGALAVGSGVMPVSRILHIRERTNDKETVTSIVHASRETPNVVEEGFGTGFLVSLQDGEATPLMRSVGALHVLWDDPAASALKTILRLMVRDGSLPMKEAAKFHADGSEIDGIPYAAKALELVERKVVTGSAVEEVAFTGLDGDVDRVYQLIALIKNADASPRTYYLRPNDVGGTDTDSSRADWDGSTVTSSGSTYLRICSAGAGEWMLADVLFYAKTGQTRMMRSIEAYESGSDGKGAVHGGVWQDTSSKVTSLVVKGSATGTIAVGSEFSLYRIL